MLVQMIGMDQLVQIIMGLRMIHISRVRHFFAGLPVNGYIQTVDHPDTHREGDDHDPYAQPTGLLCGFGGFDEQVEADDRGHDAACEG